jgi:hypothetical protein
MQYKRPSTLNIINASVMMLGVIILVVAMIPWMNWAEFDRTSAIAMVDYRLQANFDAVGFDYVIETESSGGGGMIGGGGIGGNFSRSDSKTYPEVRGEFLDNIGILYDSYRTKVFPYELKMRSPPQDADITWEEVGNPAVTLNISLESDLIPWWPESGKRELKVVIELESIDLLDQVGEAEKDRIHIQMNKVSVKAKTGYDKETAEYTGEDVILGERERTLIFSDVGDRSTLIFDIGFPEGTEAAGFYVEVQGNMTDFWGRPELSPLSGKANPINVYPLSTPILVRGFGIPLALPLMIVSAILAIAAIMFSSFKDKPKTGLIVPAAALALIAPIWFTIGMNAAVQLLSERLSGAEQGLSWAPGLVLAYIGAFILLGAAVMSVVLTILRKRQKDSGEQGSEQEAIKPGFHRIDDHMEPEERKDAPVFRKL